MERESNPSGLKWSLIITVLMAVILIGIFLFTGFTHIFKNILIIALIILAISWIKSGLDFLKSLKQ